MKTILILILTLALMVVASLYAPPAEAQCVGGQCYGVPQTIYRPQVTYQPWQYQGSQIVTWNRAAPLRNGWVMPTAIPRRTPLRTIFFGPPIRTYHYYTPQQQVAQ